MCIFCVCQDQIRFSSLDQDALEKLIGIEAQTSASGCKLLSAAHLKRVLGQSPALLLGLPVWVGDHQEALRLRAAAAAAQRTTADLEPMNATGRTATVAGRLKAVV